jgi:hypothetical protein
LLGGGEEEDEPAPQARGQSGGSRPHLKSPLLGGGEDEDEPAPQPRRQAAGGRQHLKSPLLGAQENEDEPAPQARGPAAGGRQHLHSPLLGGADQEDDYYEEEPEPRRGGLHSPKLGGASKGGGLRSPILGGAARGDSDDYYEDEYYDEEEDPYAYEDNPNILRSPLLSSKIDEETRAKRPAPRQSREQAEEPRQSRGRQAYQQPAPTPPPAQAYQQPAPTPPPAQAYQQAAPTTPPAQSYQQPAPTPPPAQAFQQPAPSAFEQEMSAFDEEALLDEPKDVAEQSAVLKQIWRPPLPGNLAQAQFGQNPPVAGRVPWSDDVPAPGQPVAEDQFETIQNVQTPGAAVPLIETAAPVYPPKVEPGPQFKLDLPSEQTIPPCEAAPVAPPESLFHDESPLGQDFPDMSQFRRSDKPVSGLQPETVVPVTFATTAGIPEPSSYVPPELAPGDLQTLFDTKSQSELPSKPPVQAPAFIQSAQSSAAGLSAQIPPAVQTPSPPPELPPVSSRPEARPLKRSAPKLLQEDFQEDESSFDRNYSPSQGRSSGQAPYIPAQPASPIGKGLAAVAIFLALLKIPYLLAYLPGLTNPQYATAQYVWQVIDLAATTFALMALGLASLMSKN